MAVGFDVASESHTGTTGSASQASFTWNHAGGASARGALVFVFGVVTNALPPVTSVTYGGVTMTAVPYTALDTDTEPGSVRAYYLDNVATGTQAVVVNRTNNTHVMYAVCYTVTAASATEVYLPGVKTQGGTAANTAASSSGTGTGSPAGIALDDGSPGTNSLRFLAQYYGASTVLTAVSAATTVGPSIDFGLYVIQTYRETSASQGSATIGPTATTADDRAVIGLAVREIPAVTGSLTADAVLLKVESGSATAAAIIKETRTGSLTADAVIAVGVITETGSLTAGAVIAKTGSGSFAADAIIKKTVSTGVEYTLSTSVGGALGSGNDEFYAPYGIATDGTYVYVADSLNLRIVKRLCSDLSYVSQVAATVVAGPYGIATDGTYLYVSENSGNSIAKRLCSDLSFVSEVAANGSWNFAISGAYLYTVNIGYDLIEKRLCSDLSFVSSIGTPGSGDDQFLAPYGIATDGTYLYVADSANFRIVKRLCSDLSYVSQVGSQGTGSDQFYVPRDCATDGTYLYVADSFNLRIVKRLCSDLSYVSQFAVTVPPWAIDIVGTILFIAEQNDD
jgi:hypothetical protein